MRISRGKLSTPLFSMPSDPARLRVVLRNARETHNAPNVAREVDSLRAINAHLLQEVAALKEREAANQQLAERDELTGLYNRRRMMEILEGTLDEASRQKDCVGLLFIDLNGFKGVNDEYGHAAGDKILTTVAGRILARVRTGDFVCRYGGDEFVVVLPNVPDHLAVSRVADMIRERVALPYWINGCEQHLSAAIGESIYPHDGDCAQSLLQRADKAMYLRKSSRPPSPAVSFPSTTPERHTRRRGDRVKPRSGG